MVASCLASPANKAKALLRLQDVDARGSTDLHGGWTAGADGIKAHLIADGVNGTSTARRDGRVKDDPACR